MTRHEKFVHDGYLILRGVVPAARLESLRHACEVIVDRARANDPRWYTTATARTQVVPYLDEDTVETLGFALHESTFGASAEVLGRDADEVGLATVSILCNPEFEPTETPPAGQSWGTDPRNWHRDVRPDHAAPLNALLDYEDANGPGYAQWNIALHDDAIFHLVPGSQRRRMSGAESRQLNTEGGTQAPLADCVCADLQPGDGIVYNNMLLHWGSKYTQRKIRRTIHLGYRAFGPFMPHQWGCSLPERVAELLPANSSPRRRLEHGFSLYRNECTLVQDIFRAVVDDDVAGFRAGLARLHPNRDGQLTCVILLSKIARNARQLHTEMKPDGHARDGTTPCIGVEEQIARTLTTVEMEKLWQSFAVLDRMLRGDEPTHVRSFLGPPTDYLFDELPAGMTVDRVIPMMFERSR